MSYSPLYFDKRNAYRTNGSGRDMYIYTTNGGYSNKPITFPFDPSIFFFIYYLLDFQSFFL